MVPWTSLRLAVTKTSEARPGTVTSVADTDGSPATLVRSAYEVAARGGGEGAQMVVSFDL